MILGRFWIGDLATAGFIIFLVVSYTKRNGGPIKHRKDYEDNKRRFDEYVEWTRQKYKEVEDVEHERQQGKIHQEDERFPSG